MKLTMSSAETNANIRIDGEATCSPASPLTEAFCYRLVLVLQLRCLIRFAGLAIRQIFNHTN
jgi:hypothetical protein